MLRESKEQCYQKIPKFSSVSSLMEQGCEPVLTYVGNLIEAMKHEMCEAPTHKT
jgi:hypothetical protein